ncbi:MAG: SLC13 family permease [Microcoleaceae cyanobacterium]
MEVILTITILFFALIGFITEWLSAEFIALSATILLMLFNIITPEEGLSGFSNSATITVCAMFILSHGVTRTGIIQTVRNFLIKWGGKNPTRQILVLGGVIGPISAFINNTAVVAIFLPLVEDWCKQQKISVSKLMIPLSYVTILGGMMTLLGTSTNILASGLSQQLGYGEFNIFQFTPLGILTFLIGLIYLAYIVPKFLPDRKSPNSFLEDQDYNLKNYLSELIITPQSNLVGQTLKSSEIQRRFDLDVLKLIQNGIEFSQPFADKVLSVGDILVIHSRKEELLKIREEKGLSLVPDIQFKSENLEYLLTSETEKMGEALILSNSRLIGLTLKDLRFRQRYNVTVLAIRRGSEILQNQLGKIPLRFGDLLLIQGSKQSFIGLQNTREILVLEQQNIEKLRTEKAAIALLIIIGVILVSAFGLTSILLSSLIGVILMLVTGCLKPGEVYGAVRWDVILLLAGLIPLGVAMENSGTTQIIAKQLAILGENVSGFWVLACFYILTSLLTEILSNNASVVLMIPIAVEVANTLNLNPMAFIFAVTFAASNSFMTPIGYQTNTMVYSAGGYKFIDFIRAGTPLNILMAVVTPILIVALYGLS